ncbi:hypothetical protein QBC36DRAFT_188426, partial [Triangularia setosa]
IFGNLNVIWIVGGEESFDDYEDMDEDTEVEQRSITLQEFTPALAGFNRLEQLLITDELMLKCELGDIDRFHYRV